MANISRSRKLGFTLRSGVMRRETLWVSFGPVSVAMATSSTAVQIGTFSATFLLDTAPFTIVRTRGDWLVLSDQSAASESYDVGLGCAIVTSQAIAIGVTAVPTPMTDADSDAFFVYEHAHGRLEVLDATGAFEAGRDRQFDSKAMRKVPDGFNQSIVVETSSISSGAAVRVFLRQLIKLH